MSSSTSTIPSRRVGNAAWALAPQSPTRKPRSSSRLNLPSSICPGFIDRADFVLMLSDSDSDQARNTLEMRLHTKFLTNRSLAESPLAFFLIIFLKLVFKNTSTELFHCWRKTCKAISPDKRFHFVSPHLCVSLRLSAASSERRVALKPIWSFNLLPPAPLYTLRKHLPRRLSQCVVERQPHASFEPFSINLLRFAALSQRLFRVHQTHCRSHILTLHT